MKHEFTSPNLYAVPLHPRTRAILQQTSFIWLICYPYLLCNCPDLIQWNSVRVHDDEILEISVQHLKHQTFLSLVLKPLKEFHQVLVI